MGGWPPSLRTIASLIRTIASLIRTSASLIRTIASLIRTSASLIRTSASLIRTISSLIRYEAEANSLRAELAAAVARQEASAAAARELESEITNLRHAQIEASAVASASEAGLSKKLREAARAAEEAQRMADHWKAERNEALGLRAASEAAAAAYQVID